MLRRAKSFMVKERKREPPDLELSETAHLRRNYLPSQPIYEQIPADTATRKKKTEQQVTRNQSFRGLRRKFSVSLDDVVRNGIFKGKKRDGEKPVYEVQHNNASRLRIGQAKKATNDK